jgi:hypothetical protein
MLLDQEPEDLPNWHEDDADGTPEMMEGWDGEPLGDEELVHVSPWRWHLSTTPGHAAGSGHLILRPLSRALPGAETEVVIRGEVCLSELWGFPFGFWVLA